MTDRTLILQRHDLYLQSESKKLQDIDLSDLEIPSQDIRFAAIIVIVDGSESKVLKNRYPNSIASTKDLVKVSNIDYSYFMGVDVADKNAPTFSLVRIIGGVTEVVMSNTVFGENEDTFQENIKIISKYFNAKAITGV